MADQQTRYEYITIEEGDRSPSGKTRRWSVFNAKSRFWLGQVLWYGPWRQYVFSTTATLADSTTVYSAGCLRDIAEFVERVTTEHRRADR